MADAVYAIEDFPDDDLLWRIEWIGGVGYNTSVRSDPQIEICLAQLPAGETNPLSARSRASQTKRTVRIAVGLLPYISIASVWQKRRPVIKNLAASRHRLCIDTLRTECANNRKPREGDRDCCRLGNCFLPRPGRRN